MESWHYVDKEGQTRGPFSITDIKSLYSNGKIINRTYLWNGTTVARWTSIDKLPKSIKDKITSKQDTTSKPKPIDNQKQIIKQEINTKDTWWYVDFDGSTKGPINTKEITHLRQNGTIKDLTYLWNGTTIEVWTEFYKIDELKKLNIPKLAAINPSTKMSLIQRLAARMYNGGRGRRRRRRRRRSGGFGSSRSSLLCMIYMILNININKYQI